MKTTTKILATLSLATFAFVFGNEADEIPVADLAIFLTALSLILVVQCAVLALLACTVKSLSSERIAIIICNVVAVLFFAANAYHTAFVIFEGTARTRILLAAGVALVFAAILFWKPFRGPAVFLAVAYVCLSLGLYAYTRVAMAYPAKTESAALTIKNPRNIYLIGMESLHSPKAFREIYGVQDLPHVTWLKEHDFRVLDSAYSADVATLFSYSRIFEFGRRVTVADVNRRTVFRTDNSTFRTFSQSGYGTQFLYKSTMFQVNPAHVSYLFPPKSFYQCDNLPADYFYALCRPPVVSFINNAVFKPPPLMKAFQSRVDVAASGGKPWFTFYHHAYPFHSNFYNSEYAKYQPFKERMRAALPKILINYQQIIGYILKKDPNAIIVTMGDHGAHMTLGLPPDQTNAQLSAAETLEDQYGVMLAVYPADFCRNRIFEGASTTYTIESIAKCLNGDDSPTDADIVRSRMIVWVDKEKSLKAFTDPSAQPLPTFPRLLPPRK